MARNKKFKGSWFLPLDIAIVSWGNIGWTLRINIWRFTIESRKFHWPEGHKDLLKCAHTPHHLLPCIIRYRGGIYGTPHGDFQFSSIGVYWLIWRWEKKLR